MKRTDFFKFIFIWLIILCPFQTATAVELLKAPGPFKQNPWVNVKISVISAIRQTAYFTGSITAFRPFEFSAGIISNAAKFESGYLFKTGLAIPIEKYTSNTNKSRSALVLLGYTNMIPKNNLIDIAYNPLPDPPDKMESLTFEIGLDYIDKLTPYFGLCWQASLGINYWITEWEEIENFEPLFDVAFGVAF
ncbi:MAG: hypothetical protein HQK83_00570 [Fibrobacteria bacterium]|nr:hypothetical protein [Fibrobacteria bacterium]